MLNFTKAMADTGKGQTVRINAIDLGLIETDRFSRDVEGTQRDQGVSREDAVGFPLSAHGTTRIGQPVGRDRLRA
jgi:NAD(P)-dependent dehydrogenase (short-subunit alcohol dehydrogenase family)